MERNSKLGGGKTLVDGTSMVISFINWHYAIDMTWKVSIYGPPRDMQMPTLESPATESSMSFEATSSKNVQLPWQTSPLKIQMTPGTLQIQLTGPAMSLKVLALPAIKSEATVYQWS